MKKIVINFFFIILSSTLLFPKNLTLHDYDNPSASESIKELCASGGWFLAGDLGSDHATYSNLKGVAVASFKLSREFISTMAQ